MAIRRILAALAATLAIVAGGAYYVSRHPTMALPVIARTAGPTLATSLLTQHPLELKAATATRRPAVPVHISAGVPVSEAGLADAVGRTLAAAVPTRFSIPRQDLAGIPAAFRAYAAGLTGAIGTVQSIQVTGAAGTAENGSVTLTATIIVNGQPFLATAAVVIRHGAITGLSSLNLTHS
jgi:hypothetical protein